MKPGHGSLLGISVLTRLLIKLACIGLVTTFGMSYLASTQGKDPLAYLSAIDLKMPKAPTLPDLPDLPKVGAVSSGQTLVYRWTDAEGGLQFSTSPPPAGVNFSTVNLDPNANVVQATRIPEPKVKKKKSGKGGDDDGTTAENGEGESEAEEEESISPTQVGKIREQLDNIKALNDNRIDNLNSLMGQQKK